MQLSSGPRLTKVFDEKLVTILQPELSKCGGVVGDDYATVGSSRDTKSMRRQLTGGGKVSVHGCTSVV